MVYAEVTSIPLYPFWDQLKLTHTNSMWKPQVEMNTIASAFRLNALPTITHLSVPVVGLGLKLAT